MNIQKIGRAENLTGQKFNRLTAKKYEKGKWHCTCDCGKTVEARPSSLKSGNTKSCGCLQREKASLALSTYYKDYRAAKGVEGVISTDDAIQRQHFNNLRPNIMQRDNFTCPLCSTRGCKLNVHHIQTWKDSPDLRLERSNLVTLCVPCHRKVHKYNFKGSTDSYLTILLQGYVNEMENPS